MFCDKCGALLTPVKKGKKTVLMCVKCKKSSKASGVITEKAKERRDKIIIVESEERELPKTEVECPSCGNMEAFFWLIQTRAADEPPTKFFECTKCKHRWRSYS
jgi:DNA-directed RNA polymerase subunit M